MRLRDHVETVLRRWHAYETARGGSPVIDFDCAPTDEQIEPAESRLEVLSQLNRARTDAGRGGDDELVVALDAHITYLRALLGERFDLAEYVAATQGCGTAGWSTEYIDRVGQRARQVLDDVGIGWDRHTRRRLNDREQRVDADHAADAIRSAADRLEPLVRRATRADAEFDLSIETVDVDAYWAYWLDGAGSNVRLRLNRRHAEFTEVRVEQFALHEVLGHGLQYANIAACCARSDPSWVRLMAVHAPHQVAAEGLAQALPVLVPDDAAPHRRVRLDHYLQLVRAELHLAINRGVPAARCADHARSRVPFWSDAEIGDLLTDRGSDPRLRSYLWAYPAGIDWFVSLADADEKVRSDVLHAAYRRPLTPSDLAALWPAGPTVGGSHDPSLVRVRDAAVS